MRFPTALVYGAPDLSRPELRLITCSDLDPSIRHHIRQRGRVRAPRLITPAPG
jgi:hypothetical protein